jgi:hypothetical protein
VTATPPEPQPIRAALDRLAATAATGALRVGGQPGGTLWLVDGRVTYAETPVMPGVADRLTGTGRLPAAVWAAAWRAGRAEARVGQLLLDQGHLVPGELTSRVLSTVYDAAYLLLAYDDTVARFHPGLRHWLGPVAGVTVADLWAETDRRRRLLADPAGGPAPAASVPDAPPGPATPTDVAADVPTDVAAALPTDVATDVPTDVAAALPTCSDVLPDAGVAATELPSTGNGRSAGLNALPRRQGARPTNVGPYEGGSRGGPDYATLRRIRMALKSLT